MDDDDVNICWFYYMGTIDKVFRFSYMGSNGLRGRNVREARRPSTSAITRLSVRVPAWAKIIASEHTHTDLSSVILIVGIGRHGGVRTSVHPFQAFRHIIITSISCFVLPPIHFLAAKLCKGRLEDAACRDGRSTVGGKSSSRFSLSSKK